MCRGAASALAHALERSILHRDLRPAHLLVQGDGVIRLAGFGRGIALDEPDEHWPELPATDDALPYAAPEAARRADPYANAGSDLYSLGITFYELLTGRLPFAARTTAEWLHAHVAVQPPPPSAVP
ncbi:protein kinase domain-containing protein [Methylorubrum extorquens]